MNLWERTCQLLFAAMITSNLPPAVMSEVIAFFVLLAFEINCDIIDNLSSGPLRSLFVTCEELCILGYKGMREGEDICLLEVRI